MVLAKDIYKKYGKHEVLKGASIEAVSGDIIALAGKNGCGKSTFLQILAGTMKSDKGDISFYGKEAIKDRHNFLKYVAYIPQDDPLFFNLTVKDNLDFWAGGIKDPDKSVIETFELTDLLKTKVSKLSGGMKRRLSIACMVQRKNPIVLLDEPTSSLDPYFQKSITDWMISHKEHGGTIIFSTHHEHEMLLADKVCFFNDGKIESIPKENMSIDVIRGRFSKEE